MIVNAYRRMAGLTPEYFSTPEGSSEALLTLWRREDQDLRLYIDDCGEEAFVSLLLEQGGAITERRSLVTTATQAFKVGLREIVQLAPMVLEEALRYARNCMGHARLESYRVRTGSVRERAWFCNLHTLRLRRAGRLKEAQEYAIEAIKIAEQLGDLRLQGT